MNRLVLFLLLFIWSCQSDPSGGDRSYQELQGQTMGTTYLVKYYDQEGRNFQQEIDEALKNLNLEVSTYIPNSTISAFNQSERGIALDYNPNGGDAYDNIHFLANLKVALEISELSGAAFQPTIMPLVNYWGFGYTEKRAVSAVDSIKVEALMANVGLDKVRLGMDSLLKELPGVQLDFSALAKGYGVDMLGVILESYEVKDYFVEIGGEILARGESPRGDAWKAGISVPSTEALPQELAATTPLLDQAIATSGNYRNYYELEGEKYGHTINPVTGYPEKNNLLSASVITDNCTRADALATAFMVLGPDKALALAKQLEGVEAYFIVGKPDGSMATLYTDGLEAIFGD